MDSQTAANLFLPFLPSTMSLWLVPLIVVDLVLRGMALWHAAKNGQKYWFIALLTINSVGILPLIYLLLSRRKQS